MNLAQDHRSLSARQEPSSSPSYITARLIRDNLLVVICYWGLSHINYELFRRYGVLPMPIWPAASVAAAATIIWGWRIAPGIAIGALLANAVSLKAPWPVAAGVCITNTLGPMLGATLLKRRNALMPPFRRFRDAVLFLAYCVGTMAAITATGGIASAVLGGVHSLDEAPRAWLRWWVGHSSGALLLAPAFLCWWMGFDDQSIARKFERTLIFLGTPLLTLFVFWMPRGHHGLVDGTQFLMIIPLVWAATRFSLRESLSLPALFAAVAITGTVSGRGPFADHQYPMVAVGFMFVGYSLTTILLASAIHERNDGEREKQAFYSETVRSVTDGKLLIVPLENIERAEASARYGAEATCAQEASEIRDQLRTLYQQCSISEDDMFSFLLACGEAITNALKHAGSGRVLAGYDDGAIWLSVSDSGPGMTTLALPSATLRKGFSTKASMGMGYTIMLEACDTVSLYTSRRGTSVLLAKNVAPGIPDLAIEDLPDTWGSDSMSLS